mgnify:FL=1
MKISLCNEDREIGGVSFHEQKDLEIFFNQDGSNDGILYVFTTLRAIGTHSYTVNQGIIDSEPVFAEIETTMNPDEMSNFNIEWLQKYNSTSS